MEPVITQPKSAAPIGEWRTGLCGCSSNCRICMCSWLCPCIIQGEIAEKTGECPNACIISGVGAFFCPILMLAVACMQRQQVRKAHQIEGSDIADCCLSWFCTCCVI